MISTIFLCSPSLCVRVSVKSFIGSDEPKWTAQRKREFSAQNKGTSIVYVCTIYKHFQKKSKIKPFAQQQPCVACHFVYEATIFVQKHNGKTHEKWDIEKRRTLLWSGLVCVSFAFYGCLLVFICVWSINWLLGIAQHFCSMLCVSS